MPTTLSYNTYTRSVSAESSYSESNSRTGIVRAIVSTDENDRFRTVFATGGCDYEGYEASGLPILWDHGEFAARGSLPVGNGLEIEKTRFKGRNCIRMDVRFSDEDEFSRQIGKAYRNLSMRNWSIRANSRTISAGPPTAAELRSRPDWADAHTIFRSWELVEVSAVSVPGNAGCLTQEVLRSLAARSSHRPVNRRERSEEITPRQAQEFLRELQSERRRFQAELSRDIRQILRER